MKYHLLMLGALLQIYVIGQPAIQLGPNSNSHDQIPRGRVTKHIWKSDIYAGTQRNYYLYVPKQYDSSKSSALMVFQDGHTYVDVEGDFRVPIVFDNLIAQGKMPVTIGLFINPGHDGTLPPPETLWRSSNRSIEYDTLSPKYAEFLEREMIPELQKNYRISDDPSMRAICGISSGGICAFTVAWSRPDLFRKVISHIGSFTDIKGGHNYPSIIRQTDPKPIKVLLQDGTGDLDNRFGNWWLANLQMEAALKFKGYDYKFVADTGAHNGVHGGLVLPQSLTWLWSDVVAKRLKSQKYSATHTDESDQILSGETMHLSHLNFNALHLDAETRLFNEPQKEQLIIIRKGQVEVSLNDQSQILGPNSVVFVAAGEKAQIKTNSSADLYHLHFISRRGFPSNRNVQSQQSFLVNFDSLPYLESKKGGRRNYFRTSTAMCPYFEMHITTLDPGIRSHPPHTHLAEELIIMISGLTEEEIGNAKYQGSRDDVYFLGAHVPHAIRNIGNDPCMYFAFQWH